MDYISEHLRRHPFTQATDLIKLVYQAVFGAEHLLNDRTAAEEYLLQEFEQTPPADGLLIEPVSDRYARVHLAAWKYKDYPIQNLFDLFYKTASNPSGATEKDFRTELANALATAESFYPEPVIERWKQECNTYLAEGIRPVHHSSTFKLVEHPAYRLISRQFLEHLST